MQVTRGFWLIWFMLDSLCLLVSIHLELYSLCIIQNLLSLAGSSHEISLRAWSCSLLVAGWFNPRILQSSLPIGLEKVPWWPIEDMAQDCEARCGIDIGSLVVWCLSLGPQVAGSHLINTFIPSGLVCIHSGRGKLVGQSLLDQHNINAITYTFIYP